LPQAEELIEGVRPKYLLVLIADVNAGPAKAHEVGGLEHGACGGDPNEFRMIAVRVFTVDGKYHAPTFPGRRLCAFAVDSAKTLESKPKRFCASPPMLPRCGRVGEFPGKA
jgi:hypothetical protein